MYHYVEQIEKCFAEYLSKTINENRLAVCLETYGKKIINDSSLKVVVKDLKYPDIFNNVNVVYKNGKFIIDNNGIYLDTSILDKFTEKELTAVFLYELGLYELLRKHKTLKYWLVIGISSPMLSQLFALSYSLTNYLEKKNISNEKIEILTKTFIMSLIVGIAVTVISHIKSVDSTGQAGKYVLKYGYNKYLKSFLKKHERPLSLYLYGAERLVKWSDYIKDVAIKLKAIIDKVSYMEGEESTGVYCNILRYEINLMYRYGINNYDYAKQIIDEFKKTCKLTGLKVLTNPIKHFKMYYAFHELEEEIEKRYAK